MVFEAFKHRDEHDSRQSSFVSWVDGLRNSHADNEGSQGDEQLATACEAVESRHNYLKISGRDDLAGGVFVEDGQCFIWGFRREGLLRPVTLKLLVDGLEIFDGVTSPASYIPIHATGYRLASHRRMVLSVDDSSVESSSFGAQAFWPSEQTRNELSHFVTGISQNVRDARLRHFVWGGLSKVGRRLEPAREPSARWRASVYTSHIASAFGLQRKLVDSQMVASWIISEVMEDAHKRDRFCLTEEILALLNESLMNQSVIKYDITLAMFAFWRRHYSHIDIFSKEGLRQVQYKFATAPFIADKNNRQLITESLRLALATPADNYRNQVLPWSWYWQLLLEDQKLGERLRDDSFVRFTSFTEVALDIIHPERHSFSPPAWRAYWSAGGTAEFTRFDLALISTLSNTPYPEVAIAEHGSTFWRDRLQRDAYERAPELSIMSAIGRAEIRPDVMRPEVPRHDLVIIGHGGQTGLGRNLGMFVDALASFNPLVFNADDGSCLNIDAAYNPRVGVRARVVLLCVNADRAPEMIARFSGICEDAHIIGFYLWESDRPPANHALGATAVDEIWAPTNYVADAYRKISSVPVSVINKGLRRPLPYVQLLDRFRNDVSEFIFLTAAEFGSSIVRKNPLDVVKAFQAAFDGTDYPVRLILKIRDVNPAHWSNIDSYWEEIEARIADDDRISVLEGDLVPEEYWTLLWTSDAIVSLHRSEGFGYVLADAMLAEKTVIVSDYSGSQDFCDESDAFLVPVKEAPAPPEYLATRGYIGQWGIPDIEAAARAMYQAVQDPELRATRARVGRDRLAEQYDFDNWSATISARIRESIERNRLSF